MRPGVEAPRWLSHQHMRCSKRFIFVLFQFNFCPQGFLSQLRLTPCSDRSLMYSSWFEIKYLQQQQQQCILLENTIWSYSTTHFDWSLISGQLYRGFTTRTSIKTLPREWRWCQWGWTFGALRWGPEFCWLSKLNRHLGGLVRWPDLSLLDTCCLRWCRARLYQMTPGV